MAKRLFVLVLAVLLGGQSGFAGFDHSEQAAPPRLESLLPPDILAVVFVEDVAALKRNLLQTRFYQLVQSRSPESALARSLHDLVEALPTKASARFALALFDQPASAAMPLSAALIADVAEPSLRDRAVRRFEEKYAASKPTIRERQTIRIITVEGASAGDTLSLARTDPFLILGQTTAVEKIVGGIEAKPKLPDTPVYRLAVEKPATEPLHGFVNLEKLSNYLIMTVTANPGRGGVPLLVPALQFAGIAALKAATFSSRFADAKVTDEIHLIVDTQRKNLITALLEIPPIPFAALAWLPEDTAFALALGTNLNQVYDAVLATLGPLIRMQLGGQTAEGAIATLEADLGFRIRADLIQSLGNELVLAYIPRMGPSSTDLERIILLTVTNSRLLTAIAEKVYQRLKNQRTTTESLVTYKSVTIYPLDPTISVAVVRNALIIGSLEAIQRVIDGDESGRTLARSASLQARLASSNTAGLLLYMSPMMFRLPVVGQMLGANTEPLLRALEAEWNPPVFGLGSKETTGIELKVTTPWSLPLTLDLLLASRSLGSSASPARAPTEPLASYLRLLSEMSQLVDAASGPRQ